MNLTLLQAAGGNGGMLNIIMIVAMFVVFYFFMIRPQQKKKKELEKYISEIKQGDAIITLGGIHGKVTTVNDTTVVIACEGGSKFKVEKSAIVSDASAIMNTSK